LITGDNPAISFWPSERQLDGSPSVSDTDYREILVAACRLAQVERKAMADADTTLARVRNRIKTPVARMYSAMQIANALRAERRDLSDQVDVRR